MWVVLSAARAHRLMFTTLYCDRVSISVVSSWVECWHTFQVRAAVGGLSRVYLSIPKTTLYTGRFPDGSGGRWSGGCGVAERWPRSNLPARWNDGGMQRSETESRCGIMSPSVFEGRRSAVFWEEGSSTWRSASTTCSDGLFFTRNHLTKAENSMSANLHQNNRHIVWPTVLWQNLWLMVISKPISHACFILI